MLAVALMPLLVWLPLQTPRPLLLPARPSSVPNRCQKAVTHQCDHEGGGGVPGAQILLLSLGLAASSGGHAPMPWQPRFLCGSALATRGDARFNICTTAAIPGPTPLPRHRAPMGAPVGRLDTSAPRSSSRFVHLPIQASSQPASQPATQLPLHPPFQRANPPTPQPSTCAASKAATQPQGHSATQLHSPGPEWQPTPISPWSPSESQRLPA